MFSLIIYILVAAVGFMMAVLYKRTETSLNFFNPDPKTWLRYFTILFASGLLLTYLLSWLTMRSLTNSQMPEDGNIQYQSMKETMYFSLNIFFLLLVVICNLYSQSRKSVAWGAYLLVIGFYSVFILKDAYYISNYYLLWQKAMLLFKGEAPDFTQTAWTKVGIGTFVTALNAVLMWWGMRK